MASDLEKARRIVAGYERFIGKGGTHRDNIAKAVAEGIALGRKEGLELAENAVQEAILRHKVKVTVKEVQNFEKHEPKAKR